MQCIHKDDFQPVMEKILDSDAIIRLRAGLRAGADRMYQGFCRPHGAGT